MNMKWGCIQLGQSAHSRCRAIKKELAKNITEIDIKEQGLEPSSPRCAGEVACQQVGLNDTWLHGSHMIST